METGGVPTRVLHPQANVVVSMSNDKVNFSTGTVAPVWPMVAQFIRIVNTSGVAITAWFQPEATDGTSKGCDR